MTCSAIRYGPWFAFLPGGATIPASPYFSALSGIGATFRTAPNLRIGPAEKSQQSLSYPPTTLRVITSKVEADHNPTAMNGVILRPGRTQA